MSLKTRSSLKPSSIYDEYSHITIFNIGMFNQVYQLITDFSIIPIPTL